ncbi:response regulator transcription factor [Paenibacillus ginsengarvi]|uniref:DNA-binding response regulator n=1 Tax=Paenibacillus ginsengarvi TaxID=400777 RepID=A0A3B0B0M2_9BACL|nr:response regulator transcription factor [Paenibacillus ginsengarvi]RKN66072.1 DNA-binding response regulator [Paenibacillus ginsengarvi]
MIRILIADDQTLLRDGLQTILALEEDFEVVGAARNGLEAWELAAASRPDVVLMDIKMPVLDGISGLKRIKRDRPETVVLMLTTFAEDKFIVDAMTAGADGFLLKDMPGERIIGHIREALHGHMMLPAPVAAKLAARLSALSGAGFDTFDEGELTRRGLSFTERERSIIHLLTEGHSNKEIAGAMYMSEGTVRNYVSSIYQKIGTNDRRTAITRLRELFLQDAP